MTNQPKDTTAILGLVKRYQEAIRTQDTKAFGALWSGADTDTLISVQKVFVGTESLTQDFLLGTIQKAYASIELIADEEPQIHFLDDNHAIVIFRYHTECTKREDGSAFGISGLETQVLGRQGGEWKLCHIHYSK